MKKAILLIIFFLVSPIIVNSAEIIYVQSKKAQIMAAPSFGSHNVGVAVQGDKLTIIEKNEDGWYKVKVGESSGWINRLNVSMTPPLNKISIINNSDKSTSLENKSRVRASAITSAAAARGLTEDERKRASSTENADYKSLEKLETSTKDISDKEIEEFNAPKK